MIILIRAAVFGTNTTYVCYYNLTRSAMSGSKRQRVTPQQRDDFATCPASEQQWLERNSKMTIAGCNEELGFPIAQVDEVMHMVMHTYIMMHMLILQVWGWFQQLTVEHNLTRKFTAHDFCMALKQHHTYRATIGQSHNADSWTSTPISIQLSAMKLYLRRESCPVYTGLQRYCVHIGHR